MPTVHTFFWLPDEHEEFVQHLATSPDIWATFGGLDPDPVVVQPAPVAEYFARLREAGDRAPGGAVYLGSRAAVLHPPTKDAQRTEGGTHVPFLQDGKPVPGVSTIVGGTKVKFRTIDFWNAELLDYRLGILRADGSLSQSNLVYYSGGWRGEQYVTKSDAFLGWAKRVVAWVRRRTKAMVPAGSGNATFPCTKRVAEAHSEGLALTY
jgi:hypothetical protein